MRALYDRWVRATGEEVQVFEEKIGPRTFEMTVVVDLDEKEPRVVNDRHRFANQLREADGVPLVPGPYTRRTA